MNKQYLVTVLLAAVAAWALFSYQTTQQPYSFEQYKAEYQKSYLRSGQEQYRKAIFLRNMARIAEHNADPKKTYEMGVNQFTDLADAEFEAIYLTLKVSKQNVNIVGQSVNPIVGDVNWVEKKKVTGVKNQGACGSCWAFSATASLESALLIKDQQAQSVDLSEQQLNDCSWSYGNQGCNGGYMTSAFKYIRDKGITTSDKYPYKAIDQACKVDGGEFKIFGFINVAGCDYLANALNERPISVAVDASRWSSYKNGVLSNCGTSLNHGVLLVGIKGDEHWLIKNSWGTSWGEDGYIRLASGNTCGICVDAAFPF